MSNNTATTTAAAKPIRPLLRGSVNWSQKTNRVFPIADTENPLLCTPLASVPKPQVQPTIGKCQDNVQNKLADNAAPVAFVFNLIPPTPRPQGYKETTRDELKLASKHIADPTRLHAVISKKGIHHKKRSTSKSTEKAKRTTTPTTTTSRSDKTQPTEIAKRTTSTTTTTTAHSDKAQHTEKAKRTTTTTTTTSSDKAQTIEKPASHRRSSRHSHTDRPRTSSRSSSRRHDTQSATANATTTPTTSTSAATTKATTTATTNATTIDDIDSSEDDIFYDAQEVSDDELWAELRAIAADINTIKADFDAQLWAELRAIAADIDTIKAKLDAPRPSSWLDTADKLKTRVLTGDFWRFIA